MKKKEKVTEEVEFKNSLHPPITFSELLTKLVVTPRAPNGFVSSLLDFDIRAVVYPKKKY